MRKSDTGPSGIGLTLSTNRWAGICEILSVFAVAAIIITGGLQLVGATLFARQLVIFTANIAMLALVWAGLRVRGQGWEHFGLSLHFSGWRPVWQTFLKSLAVFVVAVMAFLLGAVVMANISGAPQQADMSGYNYLSGNVSLLIISLIAIFFVSSFGEEVIYRAFLITRISELGDSSKAALRISVVTSALVFGLAHYGWGLTGVVQTTFMGLALALFYLLFKKNLWILVMAHAYMDSLLIIPLYFSE